MEGVITDLPKHRFSKTIFYRRLRLLLEATVLQERQLICGGAIEGLLGEPLVPPFDRRFAPGAEPLRQTKQAFLVVCTLAGRVLRHLANTMCFMCCGHFTIISPGQMSSSNMSPSDSDRLKWYFTFVLGTWLRASVDDFPFTGSPIPRNT